MRGRQLYVTCPTCGKFHAKSEFTFSEYQCNRCHNEMTAFAHQGVVVGIDMDVERTEEDVDQIEKYFSRLTYIMRQRTPQPRHRETQCKAVV